MSVHQVNVKRINWEKLDADKVENTIWEQVWEDLYSLKFISAWIFKHLFLIELWFNLVKIIYSCYFISLMLHTLQNLAPTKFNDFTVHRYIELHMILISEEQWYQIKDHKPSTALTFDFDFQLGNDDLDDVIKYLELENHFSVQNKKTSECMFCADYFICLDFNRDTFSLYALNMHYKCKKISLKESYLKQWSEFSNPCSHIDEFYVITCYVQSSWNVL